MQKTVALLLTLLLVALAGCNTMRGQGKKAQ